MMNPRNAKAPGGSPQTHRRPNQNQIQQADNYNTRPLEIIIPRLENVKRTGEGKFIARCPAHGDKSPSLSIKELSGGEVLIHCFAGCEAKQVMHSIGLELRDLFPHHPEYQYIQQKAPRFTALELLHLVHFEALIVLLAARDLSRNTPLSLDDTDRLGLSVRILESVLKEVSNGYH